MYDGLLRVAIFGLERKVKLRSEAPIWLEGSELMVAEQPGWVAKHLERLLSAVGGRMKRKQKLPAQIPIGERKGCGIPG